jgi:drug/metabolite transporter (DMT)-like permease
VVVICYLTCALVWGTTWFVIRVSIAHDGDAGFPPYLAAALRFTVASAILGLIVAIGAARPLPRTRRQLTWLTAAGIANGVGYTLVYTAERTLSGGVMAVLFGTIPLVTAAASTALGIERVRRGQVWSACIGLAGIGVISSDSLLGGGAHATAFAAALTAVLASTLFSVVLKYGMRGVHPLSGTAVFVAATTVVTWIAAVPELGAMPWPLPGKATLATLYLAVFGSVVAFACYALLIKRVSLMTANSLVLVQPVIALLLDAALEHHARLAPLTWLGVVITLGGVVVNVLLRSKPDALPSPEN